MSNSEMSLIAHLMRRAGMGANRTELEALAARGYDAVVDDLLHPERFSEGGLDIIHPYVNGTLPPEPIPDDDDDLLLRYYGGIGSSSGSSQGKWMYRMVNSKRPLKEKMSLFWHQVFACAASKSAHPRTNRRQIEMFRRVGLSNVRHILTELSKDPAMIFWLDNNENHREGPNENYGRELLELFSMGVGNYTEEDVKAATMAFTGWSFRQPVHGSVPFGKWATNFEYFDEDHDEEPKTFLGETGRFNGEDIIEIIAKQPATARFISRHMYNFFVTDEPPVSSWNEIPPQDSEAIETLVGAYFDSKGDARHMLRTLFNSDFFKDAPFKKVKSPAEMVGGLLKLVGTYKFPTPGINHYAGAAGLMGQSLMMPLTVEGWLTGQAWIDGGTLNERVNFAVDEVADPEKPGVRDIIERVASNGGSLSPDEFVDKSLDLVGPIEVGDETRQELLEYATSEGDLKFGTSEDKERSEGRVVKMVQLIVSSREFQFG